MKRGTAVGCAVAAAVALGGCGGAAAGRSSAHGSAGRAGSAASSSTTTATVAAHAVAATVTSRARHPAVTVPAIVRHSGSELAVYERVTIHGHPYLLRLDTGDSRTLIYAGVASALHLPQRGATQLVQTVGCEVSDQPVVLSHWRLGTMRLPDTTAISQQEPGDPDGARIGGIPIAGLLGNDVLSRLHRVTIEFRRDRLIIGAARVRGGHTVSMTVHHGPRDAIDITVRATVNGVTANYMVDTGAPVPLLVPGVADHLGLTVTGAERDLSGGAGCTDDATPVSIDHWRLGRVTLPATTGYSSAETFVVPEDGHDIDGLIDSGTLASFGRVTLEYGRGRLVLGGSVR